VGRAGSSKPSTGRAPFTSRQGQFLAFIQLYRKLHRRGPAEFDIVKFFRVTPPSVHGMIVKLEQLGLVTREPGIARSVRVVVPKDELPELEDVEGPPW
jgi:DNA-binding MarR family transcriptional regulator